MPIQNFASAPRFGQVSLERTNDGSNGRQQFRFLLTDADATSADARTLGAKQDAKGNTEFPFYFVENSRNSWYQTTYNALHFGTPEPVKDLGERALKYVPGEKRHASEEMDAFINLLKEAKKQTEKPLFSEVFDALKSWLKYRVWETDSVHEKALNAKGDAAAWQEHTAAGAATAQSFAKKLDSIAD